jgi:Rrf2 family transcriptional regulator, iron-sulfur cluster assembly transcription factor
MRLTTKGRFAVTAMIDLAMRQHNGPVTLAGISQRQKISLSYLEQLFGKLRRHELVESTRGPGGGYSLARPLKDVSVADIIFAVDEPLDATQCGGQENCHDDGPCMTHQLWASLNAKMLEFLDSVTLQNLVEQQREAPAAAARPKPISILREHRAALEIPTSTLQIISSHGTRAAVDPQLDTAMTSPN